MSDTEETIRRCFIAAYAQEYVEEMERLASRMCPPFCNWIDDGRMIYIYRSDEEDNFRSWTAYYMWSRATHMHVMRDSVIAIYHRDVARYGFCDEDIESILYRYGDPFSRLMDSWYDDFEMCLHEILLE